MYIHCKVVACLQKITNQSYISLLLGNEKMDLFVFLTRYLEFRGHGPPDFYFFKVGQILNLNKLILSILNVLRAGVAFVHFGMAICS